MSLLFYYIWNKQEVIMNETCRPHEYRHYDVQAEQVQKKKFSTPMLVVKNNELVVDQAVRQ